VVVQKSLGFLSVSNFEYGRYIGFYEPYYNSHDTLDKDKDVQEEVRNVARSVVSAVCQLRAGKLAQSDRKIKWPRPK
jgi:hypothetical protein